MHYLLFYEKTPDYLERQGPLAQGHREHLEQAVRAGTLVLGGSLGDPVDGSAIVLFKADSPAPVEAFAAADPYVTGGVVSKWHVRAWDTVVGSLAERPL